jgi:hypothetical protein
MKTIRRSLAALELLLIFPAVLFMTALFARSIQPQQFEPAHTAQVIVDWFAARTHVGLWLFLIAFPLSVLLLGAVSLSREWRRDPSLRNDARTMLSLIRPNIATLLIACTTITAFGILAIVALHMITD